MISAVRCAIFDADGTLLDSMAMWDKLDDEFLARRGIPSDPIVNQELHGMYFEECPAYFRKKFGIKGTVCGDTLAALAQYGTTFGVSSRAMGNVDDDGIVSDLKIVTADVVLNPSIGEFVSTDGNRFVNGILESKRWLVDNHGLLVECKIEDLEKKVSKMPNTHISSKKSKFLADAVFDFFRSISLS